MAEPGEVVRDDWPLFKWLYILIQDLDWGKKYIDDTNTMKMFILSFEEFEK